MSPSLLDHRVVLAGWGDTEIHSGQSVLYATVLYVNYPNIDIFAINFKSNV